MARRKREAPAGLWEMLDERRRARLAAETPEERAARKAEKRDYDRRRYLLLREETLARMREYREANALKISARYAERMTEEMRAEKRARQRAAYAADPEKVRARKRAWYAKNPDYARQADRDRYQRDGERIRERKRRQKKRGNHIESDKGEKCNPNSGAVRWGK